MKLKKLLSLAKSKPDYMEKLSVYYFAATNSTKFGVGQLLDSNPKQATLGNYFC